MLNRARSLSSILSDLNNRMPDIEFVQDLMLRLETVYDEGAIDLNSEHGLTPPDNPIHGHPGVLKERRIGIAMHESLVTLDGRALHLEMFEGLEPGLAKYIDKRWVLEFAKQLASLGLASATMQVLLIGMAVKRMRLSVQRADDLIELVRAEPLAEIATQYMSRATRLFLAGFDEECVIMCACVLEAAYADRFDERVMREHKKGRKRGRDWIFDAREYEDVALQLKVFSRSEGLLAARLRVIRNILVHRSPLADDLSALDALNICATLLNRLRPELPPQAADSADGWSG